MLLTRHPCTLFAVLALALFSPVVAAKPIVGAALGAISARIESRFTPLDRSRCRRLVGDPDGGRWTCRGLVGFDILFTENNLRQFIAYGKQGKAQKASTQTLGAANSIFGSARDRTTVEWRGNMVKGRFEPFATIVRYHTQDAESVSSGSGPTAKDRKGQVLVISKLGSSDGTDACHVAYVDARANADANAIAEKAADDDARAFDCRRPPRILGKTGKSPMDEKLKV